MILHGQGRTGWGISGIPLYYRYTKDESAFNLFEGIMNYFLNRLPADDVCYWDLIFGDGSGQSRDSSAAAVAVCGMHEMMKYSCLRRMKRRKPTGEPCTASCVL